MFECATMEHAVEVVRALAALDEKGDIALGRSKNRFVRPSAGGWMDCLVNFTLKATTGCVCEVQIVHQQLLTVRAELGAHHSYGTYRSAGELLEWLGVEGLIAQSPEQRKRAVLETVLGMLRTEGGAPIEPPAEEEAGWDEVVGEQTWGLLPAVPENAWPRIERLRLPEWCEEATGWCVDRPPRRSSLAAAVLREGLSGVMPRPQVGRKKGTKLAEGLAALEREAVGETAAAGTKLAGWLAGEHGSCVNYY